MNSNAQVFCNSPFMGQQCTPPTSSRSMPFGSDGSSDSISAGNQTTTLTDGGQTTRRSLPKSLHGNYEGDLSMFASRFKAQKTATGALVVEQILETEIDQVLNEEIVEESNESEQSLVVELEMQQSPLLFGLWHSHKAKLLNATQLKKLGAAIDAIRHNILVQKFIGALKFIMLMIIHILRVSLTNVVVRIANLGWSASRIRNMLRNCSRRLLWCIVLAKYGDLQLFGLTMLLVPLVFLIAVLGFIFALYSVIRLGIQSFMGYVRHMDLKSPRYED